MSDESDSRMVENLRRLIETVDIASALTEPLATTLKNLLAVSASELDSGEASVLVRDGADGDLRFLSAVGRVAEKLLNMRIPAGKGIAGFVMSSGQPIAVADVSSEENFYDEVDKSTGFSTQSILATPLRKDGDIIGVLEYVNRVGEPPFSPFTAAEMDKAAMFAEVVASLVSAYESAKVFRDFGEAALGSEVAFDVESVHGWLADMRDAPEHKEMIRLAALIREVAARGDAERTLCTEILESIIRFSDARSASMFPGYQNS